METNNQIKKGLLPKDMAASMQSAIAVLPSKIINTEKTCNAFLNLADPVIANLSRSRQIIVRPTTASYMFNSYDPEDIGFALGVDYVVDSRVQETDGQIRVTAQLVRVLDGKSLWKEDYKEPSHNIALVENSISKQVVQILNLQSDDESELSSACVDNLKVYRKFKLGRAAFTESRFYKAICCFEKAIKIDENFAPAYAGLADCYLWMGIYNVDSPEKTFAEAKKWANLALEKDGNLADVHASLGYKNMFDRNWSDAESEFKLAINLNRSCATAHMGYAHLLTALRRFEEASEQIEMALEIDPFSPIVNLVKGFVQYYSGQYKEGLEQFRYTVSLNQQSHAAHYAVALAASTQEGGLKEALEAVHKAAIYSDNNSQKRALKAYLLAMLGEKDLAQEELEQLNKERMSSYVSPFHIAAIYAALDEPERAFLCLEETFDIKDQWLVLLRDDPRFIKLHENTRYKHLIQRLNFSPILK